MAWKQGFCISEGLRCGGFDLIPNRRRKPPPGWAEVSVVCLE